jgi:hypothetical protein
MLLEVSIVLVNHLSDVGSDAGAIVTIDAALAAFRATPVAPRAAGETEAQERASFLQGLNKWD